MKKIIYKQEPSNSCYANCYDCEFTVQSINNNDIKRVKNKIKQHILETGHDVYVKKEQEAVYIRK